MDGAGYQPLILDFMWFDHLPATDSPPGLSYGGLTLFCELHVDGLIEFLKISFAVIINYK